MDEKTTNTLMDVLCRTSPQNINAYLEEYGANILSTDKPFATYMRTMFKKKGLKQQVVFLAADISEGYGYKLVAEEKRTKQRDVILRLCIAARFSLVEVQRALKLYGMSPLYPRMRRDAVLIVAINTGFCDIVAIDEMLKMHDTLPLYACKDSE